MIQRDGLTVGVSSTAKNKVKNKTEMLDKRLFLLEQKFGANLT